MADKENYYIPVEGKLVEVEKTVYTAYYKMSRRERYLEERDQENGVMSYDALDHNGMVGQEAFQDVQAGTLEDILKNEKYIGDCLNQKTYMTEELPRRCLRNRGEYTQYYVEDSHPAIIDREAFVAVQALLQMRARGHVQHTVETSPMAAKIVCGKCGSGFRRKQTSDRYVYACRTRLNNIDACDMLQIREDEIKEAWNIRGNKKIVWRCVSRLDHGTKYCKQSPTMEETALQRAIMNAVNSTMDSREDLVKGITDTVILMLKPKENAVFTLGEVKRRISELTAEFYRLFEMDGSEEKHKKRFSEITEELAELKKQQEEISAQLRNNQGVQAKIQRMSTAADRMQHHLTEWDEEMIRQIIHTVEVISADRIRVVLTDGSVVMQEVHNQ